MGKVTPCSTRDARDRRRALDGRLCELRHAQLPAQQRGERSDRRQRFRAADEQAFERDLAAAQEIRLHALRERSLAEKIKEQGASLFSYWL
jgi:hypothetical protein